jgi:hypothetical protein
MTSNRALPKTRLRGWGERLELGNVGFLKPWPNSLVFQYILLPEAFPFRVPRPRFWPLTPEDSAIAKKNGFASLATPTCRHRVSVSNERHGMALMLIHACTPQFWPRHDERTGTSVEPNVYDNVMRLSLRHGRFRNCCPTLILMHVLLAAYI